MQFRYRSNTYRVKNNSIGTVKLGITAKFLGQTYNVRPTEYPFFLQPNFSKNRGILYQR